ncbi:MAG: dCTP deaminase domain-containing protein, partial [Planctomycetota bacterium]
MVLGADRILQLVESGVEVETPDGSTAVKPLVEGLSRDQIEGIEGTTVDLRVGALFRPLSGAKLHTDSRVTPKIECVADVERGDRFYTVKPGEYLLAQTIETVNLPDSLFAYLSERTTMFRSGLFIAATFISPNYQGKLTCAIKNLSDYDVEIEL